MPARRGLLIDVCWQTRECTTNNHVLQTDESCLMPLTLIAVQKIVEIDLVEALETTLFLEPRNFGIETYLNSVA